jgi:uncharacterized membrane protein
MTAPHANNLIEGYLARLRLAAADLPAATREELVSDMESHIAEARRREPDETDATILNILDRLGEPDLVVEEARQRPVPADQPSSPRRPVGTQQPAWLAWLVPGLLVVLWPIGVVILWYSSAWDGRDKVIGTFLTLGGYPFAFIFVIHVAHGVLPGTVISGILSTVVGLMPAIVAGYMTYRLRWGRPMRTAAA